MVLSRINFCSSLTMMIDWHGIHLQIFFLHILGRENGKVLNT